MKHGTSYVNFLFQSFAIANNAIITLKDFKKESYAKTSLHIFLT